MKTKLFMFYVFLLLFSSCSTVLYVGDGLTKIRSSAVFAKNEYQAQERIASSKIVEYLERSSGITVSKSLSIDYAYGLYLGNLRMINRENFIEVSKYDGGGWSIVKRIPKGQVVDCSFAASTNKVAQVVLVRGTLNGIFITITQKKMVVGRYKM